MEMGSLLMLIVIAIVIYICYRGILNIIKEIKK